MLTALGSEEARALSFDARVLRHSNFFQPADSGPGFRAPGLGLAGFISTVCLSFEAHRPVRPTFRQLEMAHRAPAATGTH